jgi:hypothetical protein
VARFGLAFDQRNASPFARERDRSSTAGYSAAEDKDFVLQRNLIQVGHFQWFSVIRRGE